MRGRAQIRHGSGSLRESAKAHQRLADQGRALTPVERNQAWRRAASIDHDEGLHTLAIEIVLRALWTEDEQRLNSRLPSIDSIMAVSSPQM